MAPTTTPHIAPITGGVELFRSCLVSTQYPGVEAATRWLFGQLDVEYVVNPDQTCCTGLGYYTDVVSFPTTVAVAARNACVAVEAGHPVQAYLCSTCYAINRKAHEALEDPEQRGRTNRVLERIGRRYDDTVAGAVQHRHVLEILWSRHPSIRGLVRRRLAGVKVATHPACHYCKVFPDEVLGDSEDLMLPEDLLQPTGVTSTGYYPEKATHCGAGFRQRFINPAMSMALTREKLRRLAEQGVDVCVHMCPNCHVQFDRFHDVISQTAAEDYPFVHLHVQQLLALALGADPDTVCGVEAHSQDLEPFLERIGARERRSAGAAAAAPTAAGAGASAGVEAGLG
ncbi:MAG: CoB--CoM heterodisulfide reductase iron-sulfur subunit B family protein [Candidatus Dormibacteria bacterium]|jgi:heterodisulfide reductase subunit B